MTAERPETTRKEGMRLRPWGETSEASAASVRGAYRRRKEVRTRAGTAVR
jgi:hypothetical protein